MHQAVRAAMSKKTQTLNNSVARYNEECSAILKMWPAACQIPRPEPLPTSLTDLKTCTTLMESVWISKVEESHLWVRDPDVREGIRAMHKVERCVEERKRLGKEADNMLFYYQRRLTAVCEALCDPASAYSNVVTVFSDSFIVLQILTSYASFNTSTITSFPCQTHGRTTSSLKASTKPSLRWSLRHCRKRLSPG